MRVLAGIGVLTLLTACSDDATADTDGAGSTGSDTTASPMTTTEPTTLGNSTLEPGTSTIDPDSGTTASVDTGTTRFTATEDTGTTGDSETTGDSSTTGDTGTTGAGTGNGNCLDQDIGMAIGTPVSSGSTVGEGDDFDSAACIGGSSVGPGDDYVIAWTPPLSGPFVLSLEGSSYDTHLSVTEPVCGVEHIACNDDCFDLESALVFDATMGETVFIVIDGFDGDAGNFILSITVGSDLDCGFGETDGVDIGGFIAPTGGFMDTGIGFIAEPTG